MPTSPDRAPSSITSPRSTVSDVPIFLTGFARSGTTWLNRLMRDYFDAGFVNEGQFIVAFGNRLHHYGNLQIAYNHERLVADLANDKFFSILKNNYNVGIDWNEIAVGSKSFPWILKNILRQIAERMGKHRIGSKYPAFGRHLDLLNSLFPDCRVIHLIRDGRDCALSHKSMTWGHQNTYSAAIHWRRYLETARRSSLGMRDRYLEVRYEDLLLEPEATMSILEHFITSGHEYLITKRFVDDHVLLKTEKVGQWRHAMSVRSQAIFESTAGDMLKLHGYPLTGVNHSPSFLFKTGYVVHDRLSREGWHLARKIFKNIPEHR